MPKLIIDIETVGEDFDSFDATTQKEATKRIEEKAGTPAYEVKLEEIKRNLVFSPLTGSIVAIGVLDYEKGKGVVYYQAPEADLLDTTEGNFTYKPMNERDMLQSFWQGALKYNEFITFNGRGFDVPYLIARSAVHKVRITADLMANRYLNPNWQGAQHIDLFDQLKYFGATRSAGSLHMWCRALGIDSPKEGEVNAGDVGLSFREKKYLEIAQYNARDVVATKDLYTYWNSYMRP